MQSILVIDDQAEMRTALQLVLSAAGYQVTLATNGKEALQALLKGKVDLVITDVVMPEKDGIEVAMELRKTHPGLPVVVMTGGGKLKADVYLRMARSLGAKGILQKPFSNEQLLLTVALALTPPPA